MQHILSILVENESGALSRISALFSARGYNIESLTVSMTDDASLSRMTLVTRGTNKIVNQITKQLNKLIEVVDMVDLSEFNSIERELVLLKIKINDVNFSNIKQLSDIFEARILDVTSTTLVIELTGTSRKINSFIDVLKPQHKILEVVRTGVSGITRGNNSLQF